MTTPTPSTPNSENGVLAVIEAKAKRVVDLYVLQMNSYDHGGAALLHAALRDLAKEFGYTEI